MYCIKFLKSLIGGVLRFVRTLTTLFWRVLSSNVSNLRLRYIRQINMESDDECELDSTWEDEYENKQPRKKSYRRGHRNTYAAMDMQNFRHSVRNLDDDDDDNDEPGEGRFYNLEFYKGQIKSSPDDVHIDEFHKKWKGQYRLLEDCHSYIQWLFPIQERGVNWDAHVLTKKEIKLFRKDEDAMRKLVESYKLMLDFYGIRLVSETTGEVGLANKWEERFGNLNRYSHNNLRITRILKCLGTLGLQRYQAPLVRFFLHETLVLGHLQSVKQSVLDYFMFTVLDKSERQELVRFAFKHFKPQKHFVWGPKKFLSVEVDEENKDNNTAQHGQQRETGKRAHEVKELDASNDEKSVKQNQKVSADDAKFGEVFGKNETLGQATENITSNTAEDANIDHPPEVMRSETSSKKDHQNIKNPDSPDKLMGENIESGQGANEDSQCCSENKSGKQSVGDGDDDVGSKVLSGEEHSKNESLSQLTENKDNNTHEVSQINDSNHVKGMLNEENSGKDQVKTSSNKNNEDEQDPTDNS